ncbi:MAG: Gfo/Idh/MocA family protein, partial [Pseudomonadales bacterium]
MTRLRYGLLGAGMMGQEHMRNLRLLEEVELVAFMDTDGAMANRAQLIEPRAERVNHVDDLLAQDLDALVVATPNFQHADQLLALAEQPNLAILCEKP